MWNNEEWLRTFFEVRQLKIRGSDTLPSHVAYHLRPYGTVFALLSVYQPRSMALRSGCTLKSQEEFLKHMFMFYPNMISLSWLGAKALAIF